MRLRTTLAIIFSLIFSIASAKLDHSNQQLLDTLQYHLENLDNARERRSEELNRLKQEYRQAPDKESRVHIAGIIGHKYITEDIDSAMLYLRIALSDALQMNNYEKYMQLYLEVLSVEPAFGRGKDAIDRFEEIDTSKFSKHLRHSYWKTASEIYNTAKEPYKSGRFRDKYSKLTITAIDSLRQFYPAASPIQSYLTAMTYLLQGDNSLAAAKFINAINKLDANPDLRDFGLKIVIQHYKDRPEYRQTYINYLLRRAIYSLSRGLSRPEILSQVGEELIKEGYRSLGNELVALALTSKERSYLSPFSRFDQSEYASYLLKEADSSKRLYLIFSIAALLIAGIATFFTIRTSNRLRHTQQQLNESHQSFKQLRERAQRTNKDVISLTFLAFEQLHEYNLYVLRKLKTGQTKDLYAEVESGQQSNRIREKFFEEFDSNFLSDYPDFVENLNRLLRPDKQLSLLPGDRLTPEIRIAAFTRLGVTDSSRLAQTLMLSLNTVYTYRNRLKGRAIDRENFERDLLETT